ncbi:hypothetical protein Tco_0507428 [Tanacetum coccineum]
MTTTLDTTLALSIPPQSIIQTTPKLEPFTTPLAPRALTFSNQPRTPLEPHPYLPSTNEIPPRPINPLPQHTLPQTLPQTTLLTEKERIQQEINNLQTFQHNVQEAIQNAQHVQDSLIPPTSITHIQIPPPFYPITTSFQTPPLDPSFPPSSTFGPIDQTLWLEQPPRGQEHTCPHCQRTKTIINNFQNETRFMLNHILDRLNHLSNQLPKDDGH